MFRSYCRLWLWLNPSVVWHFLFLSPVIAHFGHFLSLSFSGRGPPTPFHGTPSSLECVKSRRARENVSSIICAVSREGERASEHFKRGSFCRCGIRGLVHTEALPHSHSSPHPSALWWRFFFFPPPAPSFAISWVLLNSFPKKSNTSFAAATTRFQRKLKFLSNNLYL